MSWKKIGKTIWSYLEIDPGCFFVVRDITWKELWPGFRSWGLKKMKFMGETILKPFLEVNHSWSSLTSKDWIEISPSISPSISLGNLRWIGELGRFVQVISSYDHLLTGKIALAFHNLRKDSRRYFYWRVKRRVLQDMMLCGLVYNHSNPIPNDRPQNGTPKMGPPKWDPQNGTPKMNRFTTFHQRVLDAFARWRQDYLISRLRKVWSDNLHVNVE